MSWYITIRPHQALAVSDTQVLVGFLRTVPELQQVSPVSFSTVAGQPWIDLTLAMAAEDGSWVNDGSFIAQFNRVELACSGSDPRQDWYDALAARIAEFLGWVAEEEHAERVIWP